MGLGESPQNGVDSMALPEKALGVIPGYGQI